MSSHADRPSWMPSANGAYDYLYDSPDQPHEYDRYFCISDKPLDRQVDKHVMPFSLTQKRNQTQTLANLRTHLKSTSPNSNVDDKFRELWGRFFMITYNKNNFCFNMFYCYFFLLVRIKNKKNISRMTL